MSGVGLGFSLARERLRGPSAPLFLLASCAALFAIGVLERQSDATSAPDDVLQGAAFGLALPLFSYLVSERACDGQRLPRSVDDRGGYLFAHLAVQISELRGPEPELAQSDIPG